MKKMHMFCLVNTNVVSLVSYKLIKKSSKAYTQYFKLVLHEFITKLQAQPIIAYLTHIH
jgi:hypothetical protein